MYIKEACVENLNEAIKAEQLGADRIELCENLNEGGTTPSFELIRQVKANLHIPIRVMIRPRAGDFCYSENEIEIMLSQIEYCKNLKLEAVVFGILNADKTLNIASITKLAQAASPLKVVIHKAIDETPNMIRACQQLIQTRKISTILTSGGKDSAEEGLSVLKTLIDLSADKIEIMPAGKITHSNIEKLHNNLKAKAYHGRRIVEE
ncbi:copper homeostasis protein [Ancylomarina subtilis]|uniref:PF03932 family protein CutC n=1 Tax=Ancylomarina subtilis TaxID=1639035 RepID=A0A4V2FRW1_9BACT|nr:copper homeostasis protein CutC [Ancylomarina subtilis]RZT91879.1 copper homeostasis protein [Ancylomarina subtilis]